MNGPPLSLLPNYCHPNGCLTNTEQERRANLVDSLGIPISVQNFSPDLCPVPTTRSLLPGGVCASPAPRTAKVKSSRELPTLPTS